MYYFLTKLVVILILYFTCKLTMLIEFQYFEGCPNSVESLANLKAAMSKLNIPEDQLKVVEVPDLVIANRLTFQGSPSILIDRNDIYTGKQPEKFSYSCRLYEFDGLQSGVIPQEFILEKLRKAQTEE
jgi:hypothetical protein